MLLSINQLWELTGRDRKTDTNLARQRPKTLEFVREIKH
jgi:hypothetical protein